ncbi:MAG: hypothetical protein AAF548_04000 [Actinomycetota bacterium]
MRTEANDARAPRGEDLQPLGLIGRAMLRFAAPIVLVGLVAGAIVYVGLDDDDGDAATAVARLGLTDEVVWPFYDAARDRLELAVTADGFAAAVSDAVGESVGPISLEIPNNQAFVELVVEADDIDAAIAGRSAAIEMLTTSSLDSGRARLEAERDLLAVDLAAAEELVLTLETEADEIIAQQVANAIAQVDDPTAADLLTEEGRLDSRLSRVLTERDSQVRTVQTLVRDLDQVEREIANVGPEIEVLRLTDEASSDSAPVVPALAAGALAAAAAALLAVIWDRERGRARDDWYVQEAVGAPVLGRVVDLDGDLSGIAAATDRILAAANGSEGAVGVVGVGPLAAGPVRAALDDELGDDPGALDLDDEFAGDDRIRDRTRECGSIVIVCSPDHTVPTLREQAAAVRASGGNLIGAVVVVSDA